jgi:hypothetical protein
MHDPRYFKVRVLGHLCVVYWIYAVATAVAPAVSAVLLHAVQGCRRSCRDIRDDLLLSVE